jgi:hypothetical protein
VAENSQLELYKTYSDASSKFTYFMLAAAGAAIAFAITKTQDASISWSQIPLAMATACWAGSFFCGARHLQYVGSGMYDNITLLKVQSGTHPDIGAHPQSIEDASSGLRKAMMTNSERGAEYGHWQFRLLILGAAAYIAWHVFEMYLRTVG